MTDGPTLPLEKSILFGGAIFNAGDRSTTTDRSDRIFAIDELPDGTQDLTTLYRWLPPQPVSTEVALLYAIAADLVRRGYPGVAFEVRRAADDLKSLTRHHEKKV